MPWFICFYGLGSYLCGVIVASIVWSSAWRQSDESK